MFRKNCFINLSVTLLILFFNSGDSVNTPKNRRTHSEDIADMNTKYDDNNVDFEIPYFIKQLMKDVLSESEKKHLNLVSNSVTENDDYGSLDFIEESYSGESLSEKNFYSAGDIITLNMLLCEIRSKLNNIFIKNDIKSDHDLIFSEEELSDDTNTEKNTPNNYCSNANNFITMLFCKINLEFVNIMNNNDRNSDNNLVSSEEELSEDTATDGNSLNNDSEKISTDTSEQNFSQPAKDDLSDDEYSYEDGVTDSERRTSDPHIMSSEWSTNHNNIAHESVNSEIRPTYFDWRSHGAVSPVKDQGSCAACWAFSIVANVESMLKIYENRKETLSEKFLIDCETGSNGCGSGSVIRALGNIIANIGGILRKEDYHPYNSRQDRCAWKRPGPSSLIAVTGFSRVKNDEDIMADMLYKYGPLSAAINSKSMEKYGSNNYIDEPTGEQCSSEPSQMDHSVLIVGYNVYVDQKTGHEVPYWIIKNSWGTGWGDQGFYYLVRGRNACGIANDVAYAKFQEGLPHYTHLFVYVRCACFLSMFSFTVRVSIFASLIYFSL